MTRTRVHIAATFALGAAIAAILAYAAPRAAEAPILPPVPTAVDKAEAAAEIRRLEALRAQAAISEARKP
jgi:hypothetical protein